MGELPTPLDIPAGVLAEVYREARRAFPFECCGWLAGPADGPEVDTVRPCENAQDSGTHPTQAARGAEPLLRAGVSMVTLTYFAAEKVMPKYNVMGVAKSALEASVRYLAYDLGKKGLRILHENNVSRKALLNVERLWSDNVIRKRLDWM